jgi:hypothetical protein
LRPDQIESIEIISNPSSKYDSEYKGIINIKLKRDKNLGWTGSLSTTFIQNAYSSSNNTFDLTYKTKKWAFTTRVGASDVTNSYQLHAVQLLNNHEYLTTLTTLPTIVKKMNYEFDLTYSLKKDQNLGVILKGYNSINNSNSVSYVFFLTLVKAKQYKRSTTMIILDQPQIIFRVT